jgi:cysteine desulfurase
VVNLSFSGIDADALMVVWRGLVAVSTGAACAAEGHRTSHVLAAMGLPDEAAQGAVRLSWCHLTPEPDWTRMVEAVRRLR